MRFGNFHQSVVVFSYCSADKTSARKRLFPPYLKGETLRELRVLCQETLTKNAFNIQTTLYISGNMHAQKRHPAAYSRLPYNIKQSHSFACQS